jgi:hypothetical protein
MGTSDKYNVHFDMMANVKCMNYLVLFSRGRYYYWNAGTDEVTWLPPMHPRTQISLSAECLKGNPVQIFVYFSNIINIDICWSKAQLKLFEHYDNMPIVMRTFSLCSTHISYLDIH